MVKSSTCKKCNGAGRVVSVNQTDVDIGDYGREYPEVKKELEKQLNGKLSVSHVVLAVQKYKLSDGRTVELQMTLETDPDEFVD